MNLSVSKKKIPIKPLKKGEDFFFFIVDWDEQYGPFIIQSYPQKKEQLLSINEVNIEELSSRLYTTSMVIYDMKDWSSTTTAQFHINYLQMDAVLVFASVDDKKVRGGQRLFMTVILAKNIHYLILLRLQEKLQKVVDLYKIDPNLDLGPIGSEIFELIYGE